MARKIFFSGILLFSILIMVSCTNAENTTGPTSQNMVYTQAVETIVAELTPPSPTLTAAALATEKAMKASAPAVVATATLTPTPTVQPSPTLPLIPIFHSDISMYCLAGPGTGYGVVSYLASGQEVEITGQSSPPGWWQIPDPHQQRYTPLGYCWVWAKGGTVSNSTLDIPIIAAPTLTTPTP